MFLMAFILLLMSNADICLQYGVLCTSIGFITQVVGRFTALGWVLVYLAN